ncbi:mitotic spindle checkpoint protein Bub3 [Gryganskiella cystojenkinii]|nr:mitotic spindle checkpoint protein Bub3 [Gryganskiella cystojenkinii]
MAAEYELFEPPTDTVSSVVFHPSRPEILMVSSWDKSVALYDTVKNQQTSKYYHDAAVLDCCFGEGMEAYSGGLDRTVRMHDFATGKGTVLGSHDDAVRAMAYSTANNFLVTGSWDKTVGTWDHRAGGVEHGHNLGKYKQPEKIFSLDVCDQKLVVAMAGRLVFIYDLRNMNETLQRRESSLKYQTRMVRCMRDGLGYASSSIEGRVAVEFFDPSAESQAKKYAFKCHRQPIDGVETIYPVNALAYHPIHGTFASGGSDGGVTLWDGFNKKRLRQYPKYPTSVSALSWSCDGKTLAVASSYTFDEGDKDHAPDQVFLRSISDQEARPKTLPPSSASSAAVVGLGL